MKLIILTFLAILTSLNALCQSKYLNPDVPLMNSMGVVDFIHVTITLPKDIDYINEGQIIGKIDTVPSRFSDRFDGEIKQSMAYYDKGDFLSAKLVLEEPLKMEPDNSFILNSYARACYKIDRKRSFKTYSKLIHDLYFKYKRPDNTVVLDMWFQEAYWKFGTLLMDNKKWTEANFEISRFLLSIQGDKGSMIYIQALQYLTECSYVLYDDKTALYLANRTLHYDSNNKYAIQIISKLK
jgi:hypothetical protein